MTTPQPKNHKPHHQITNFEQERPLKQAHITVGVPYSILQDHDQYCQVGPERMDCVITTILLDDGGVMNDNSRRGPQWQQLVGEYFAPKFGGDTEMWRLANVKAVEKIMANIDQMVEDQTVEIMDNYFRRERITWMQTMFEQVQVDLPEDEDEVAVIAKDAAMWITPQVQSAYPGMIDQIKEMGAMYELFTASNEVSYELKGYLKGMGVDNLFSNYFGPDLLGTFKTSPTYYREIIRETGLDPSQAVVIDDKLRNLEFARKAGFHTIHSGLDGTPPAEDQSKFPHYTKVADLEGLLVELDRI